MRRTFDPKSTAIVGLIGLALIAASCGSSSDPASWQQAESNVDADGGYPVERNFEEACQEAKTDEDGFDTTTAPAYCRCAFTELRESLSFDQFDALDSALRTNPDPNALEGVAAAAWRIAEPLLENCAADTAA